MKLEELPRPLGYVFGGGGSRGALQVGMLQALSEHDIGPDLVTGTSVGALNGALVALDPKGAANRLTHSWARMTRAQVFPGSVLAQVRTLEHSKTHLFPNTGLATVIGQFLGDGLSFGDLAVPFGAVTTDTASGRPHVIRQGALLSALLASAAIPGIYPSVERDGLRLCDGGVVANVPMQLALAMGARSLIVLDCFPRLSARPTGVFRRHPAPDGHGRHACSGHLRSYSGRRTSSCCLPPVFQQSSLLSTRFLLHRRTHRVGVRHGSTLPGGTRRDRPRALRITANVISVGNGCDPLLAKAGPVCAKSRAEARERGCRRWPGR
jgi:predicted acylesterase/phospholipase RssA